ncbi:MAG TPA: hypothetical protein RMH99_04330 [Sandaracinaceae bacterium LLY-WYZ-13_1]|nr:hypothetical protein [Sandaracinaceae bacterium LLY-WYZ-13_1]
MTGCGRWGLLGLAAWIVVGSSSCGGSTVGPRTNVAAQRPPGSPLPVEANRNGPPPASTEGGSAPARLVLWCSQPAGPACVAAQEELGLPATPTPAVPEALLRRARDLEDDCSDPELAPLMQRVTGAVGTAGAGWADQEGQLLEPAMIPDLYSGSGCTNAARTADPAIKIHVVELGGEPHFLVRVWEIGDGD